MVVEQMQVLVRGRMGGEMVLERRFGWAGSGPKMLGSV